MSANKPTTKNDVVADLIDDADQANLDGKESKEGIPPQALFKDAVPPGQTQDARLRDVIDGVMSTLDISVRSVLEDKHIVGLVRGRIFARRYKSKLMNELCQFLQEGRISKDGRGRKDLVATMKAAVSNPEEQNQDEGKRKFGRFFG